jgi:hypothetical protein
MGSRCWGCGEKFGRCYEHGTDECACIVHKCSGFVDYEDAD